MDLKTLLSRGFFPKEYPPPFNTKTFADYATSRTVIPVPIAGQRRLTTMPAIHNLARPGGLRRRLHVPNPFGYIRVAHLLTRNWEDVERHCQGSPLSVSIPSPDPSGLRALKPRLDGADLALERARVRSGAKFTLRTDIARFYGSIYTHSIPWALQGKSAAKRSRYGGFANDLDEALRDLQDGQTLGIPVGPDASLVVAEIVASSVDKDLHAAGLRGFRFMDDYEFGFPTRSHADAALATVEDVLAQYELAVNLRKTTIDQLPIELERAWIAEIRTYPIDSPVSRNVLVGFFNRVFELKHRFPHDPVLAYAVSRLRTVKIVSLWPTLRDIISQCALAEPGAMESFVTLLQERSNDGAPEAVDSVIQAVLEHQTDLSHGSELAWALWAAIWFKRRIPTVLAKRLDGNPDPAVALLTLCAYANGLLRQNVQFPKWQAMLTSESLYGPMWLLTYEADIQDWLKSSKRGVVSRDSNFGPLHQNGVSFFNQAVAAPTNTLIFGVPATTLGIYTGKEAVSIPK